MQFNASQLTIASSPVAGLTAFSLVAVLKVDQPGVNEASQWYGKSGIVDAEQGGVVNDWGMVVGSAGNSDSAAVTLIRRFISAINRPIPPWWMAEYHVLVCTFLGWWQPDDVSG